MEHREHFCHAFSAYYEQAGGNMALTIVAVVTTKDFVNPQNTIAAIGRAAKAWANGSDHGRAYLAQCGGRLTLNDVLENIEYDLDRPPTDDELAYYLKEEGIVMMGYRTPGNCTPLRADMPLVVAEAVETVERANGTRITVPVKVS